MGDGVSFTHIPATNDAYAYFRHVLPSKTHCNRLQHGYLVSDKTVKHLGA
jgi:hypothetical protein